MSQSGPVGEAASVRGPEDLYFLLLFYCKSGAASKESQTLFLGLGLGKGSHLRNPHL